MKQIIIVFALLCCAYNQPLMAQNKSLQSRFNQSLNHYYALKNALAADEPAEAAKLSTALLRSVKKVPHTGFASEVQHKLWMEESAKITQQCIKLGSTSDLKSQRKNFEQISAAFIRLTGELKLNETPAFVQYCPMGKNSWLNEVKTVQNPYYGLTMPDCGAVKETIVKN